MTALFFSYSHADEALRDCLEVHLAMLKRQGVIDTWHDRRLAAGDVLDAAISDHLEKADVILLLVSPDFLASTYCYEREMQRAMERHKLGEVRVLPVILRPCDWHGAPFGKLLATPKDGKPVTKHADLDDAFLDVTHAIKATLGASHGAEGVQRQPPAASKPDIEPVNRARSSNLRVRKTFSEADQDRFLDEAFEYIANFFENSLAELGARNPDIETSFKRIDAVQFSAVAYRDGKAACRCRIAHGGSHSLAGGITFAYGDGGGYNESLSAAHDEQGMFLKALLAVHRLTGQDARLTAEGASEYYWSIFIEALQH